MTNVVAFPKPFKRPRRYGSGRRVTERDRLELLLMEIQAMAKHVAIEFKMLQDKGSRVQRVRRGRAACIGASEATPMTLLNLIQLRFALWLARNAGWSG